MRAAEFAKRRARIEHNAERGERWKRNAIHHLAQEARATLIMSGDHLVGWRLANGEVVCIKQRYRNEAQAELRLLMIRGLGAGTTKPVRAYFCGHCSGWHLTSSA